MRFSTTHRRLLASAAATSLLLVACGGSTADVGGGDDAPTPDSPSAGAVDLATTPIPFRDLYDYRAGDGPASRTEVVQLDACPLLSLDTLVASSRDYSDATTLSEASAQRCSFRAGPAFSFSVMVEPAADVDVDDHSGRAYNIDVEPIVEPQSGPGDKAVTLVDTAFADLGDDDGFRYLYFFVLGDQAVTLRSTAFEVDDDGWRVLADEVAANLESGVAGGEVETVEVVDEVEPYSMEPCEFVTADQLAGLAGVDAAGITTDHERESFKCRWEHPDLGGLSFRFGAAQGDYADVAAGSTDDRRGELGILAVGPQVLYDVWLQEGDPRGFTVNADSDGWYPVADAVAVNLVQRIEKPEPL